MKHHLLLNVLQPNLCVKSEVVIYFALFFGLNINCSVLLQKSYTEESALKIKMTADVTSEAGCEVRTSFPYILTLFEDCI